MTEERAGERRITAKLAEREEQAAEVIERAGLWTSLVAAAILTGVLAGDVAVLGFGYQAPDWLLAYLRIGPIVALILGFIGTFATWYHWLRVLYRWVFRRQRPDVRKEAEGVLQDRALDIPGALDDQMRERAPALRGCRSQLQGCRAMFALGIFVATAAVVVATYGPAPVNALAISPRHASGHASGPSRSVPAPAGIRVVTGQFRQVTPVTAPFGGLPVRMIAAPDGSAWFLGGPSQQQLMHVTSSGALTRIQLPSGTEVLDIAVAPDSSVWFTEFGSTGFATTSNGASIVNEGIIGRVEPGGGITTYQLPTQTVNGQTVAPIPSGIVAGPDGNMWFTELNDFGGSTGFLTTNQAAVGRITPGGAITSYPIAGALNSAAGITVGPDGNLWVNGDNAKNLWRVMPGGATTAFALPAQLVGAGAIASGPGGAIWFLASSTDANTQYLGRADTHGAMTTYQLDLGGFINANVDGIKAGPDGNLWVAVGQFVDRLAPDGTLTEYPLAQGEFVESVVYAPNGILWAIGGDATGSASVVYRITP